MVQDTVHDLLGTQELPIDEQVEEGESSEAYELPLTDGDHPMHLGLSLLANIVLDLFFGLILKPLLFSPLLLLYGPFHIEDV